MIDFPDLEPVAAPEDIPPDTNVLMVIEQDAERLVRTPLGTRRQNLRNAVVFLYKDGKLTYTVVAMGPATGKAPVIYQGGEWSHYRDVSAWSKHEGQAERRHDQEATRQWHQTIADSAEQAALAERAATSIGPGGLFQRE